MDFVHAIGRHVAVFGERAPVGIFGAVFPRAAEIISEAGVIAPGPVLDPGQRGGLAAAVDVQNARQVLRAYGGALDAKDADLSSVCELADVGQLGIGAAVLFPRAEDLDLKRQLLHVDAAPEVLWI